MITKDSIETAYSFFHQKYQVYRYSNIDIQKEDIEYAIGSYVEQMSRELYQKISEGQSDFLLRSSRFANDLSNAVAKLETMLE